MSETPTYLVTGGAGYIGSHMVNRLINAGHRVVIVDDLSTGNTANIHAEATFVEGSILDDGVLDSIFTEHTIDGVFHFAGKLIVDESVNNPSLYYRQNIEGTRLLLDSMVEHTVPRIIFSSTAAVYGDQDEERVKESVECKPVSPYGYTKYVVEQMIRDYQAAYGSFTYAILRYFNVLGRDDFYTTDYATATHVVSNILRATKNVDEFIIFGTDYDTVDGTGVRDYIDVRDLVAAHESAMEYLRDGNDSDTFNIGTSTGHSVRQLIQAAQAVTGTQPQIREEDRRAGDIAVAIANVENAANNLNWQATTPLVDSIESMWHIFASK